MITSMFDDTVYGKIVVHWLCETVMCFEAIVCFQIWYKILVMTNIFVTKNMLMIQRHKMTNLFYGCTTHVH